MKKILFIFALFTLHTPYASAYFNDTEAGAGIFSAGSVAFVMTATTTTNTSGNFEFVLENTGTHLPLFEISPDNNTCGPVTFGNESSFGGIHTAVTTLPPGTSSCAFRVVVHAWQQGFTQGSGGFTASSSLMFTLKGSAVILPGEVLLNEIYPRPNSASSTPLDKEWIELYNTTGDVLDVDGYDIRVGIKTHQIVSTFAACGPNKMFPMTAADASIPPGGLLVLEFCNNANNAKLDNDGDVVAFSSNGAGANVIDSHTYPSTPLGKSHARIPDGGTWVDPVPTPGTMNTVTVAELEAEGWSEELIYNLKEEYPDVLLLEKVAVTTVVQELLNPVTTVFLIAVDLGTTTDETVPEEPEPTKEEEPVVLERGGNEVLIEEEVAEEFVEEIVTVVPIVVVEEFIELTDPEIDEREPEPELTLESETEPELEGSSLDITSETVLQNNLAE